MAETRAVETTGITVSSSACQNYFGFLSQRPKGTPIPEECLTCERMLGCMVSKPEATAPVVVKPELEELEAAEKVEKVEEPTAEPAEPVAVVEEVKETAIENKPTIILEKVERVMKRIGHTLKDHIPKRTKQEHCSTP